MLAQLVNIGLHQIGAKIPKVSEYAPWLGPPKKEPENKLSPMANQTLNMLRRQVNG